MARQGRGEWPDALGRGGVGGKPLYDLGGKPGCHEWIEQGWGLVALLLQLCLELGQLRAKLVQDRAQIGRNLGKKNAALWLLLGGGAVRIWLDRA
ncbi:MAG: hypothetical protein ACPG61_18915, partial [Paracoccaceae bacterium]